MDYDRILTQLGEFGPWQRRNALLLWLPAMAGGINIMVAAFAVMPPVQFRCRNECDEDGFTFRVPGHELGEIFPSYAEDNPNYCDYYRAVRLENGSCVFTDEILTCGRGAEFAYEPFKMDSTVAEENDLICGNYFWTIIIDEFFMVGVMAGSFIFGVLADRIGRRHTLLIAVLCNTFGNLLGCAMPNHWSYAISRLLASAGGLGSYLLAFTLTLEYSGVVERVPYVPWVTWSTLLANFVTVPNAVGEMVPPLIALGLRDWKEFQAAVAAVLACTATVWLFLPESPRWLIANGKNEEAKNLIVKAASINNVKLSNDIFESDPEDDKEKTEDDADKEIPVYGVVDMFRRSQIVITISLCICWPVITLLFYGLSLSADKIHLTDDVFLSYILVALIEIPAYVLLPFIIDVVGRKPLFFLAQFVPGVCCILAAYLTPGTAVFTVLVMGAKLGASAAFNITYMYTAQLFPTSIRNTAVGTCSMMARVGGMMSPVIGKYLITMGLVDEKLPMILFGAFGTVGGLCALLLPDTVGFPLPNTFDDVEKMKKNSKPIWKLHKPSNST